MAAAGTDGIRSHRKRGARVGWGKVLCPPMTMTTTHDVTPP